MLTIKSGDLDNPHVMAMLKFHFDTNRELTPPDSCHVFDLSRLKSPDVNFYVAWEGETLLGVGAFAELTAEHGEVKSMHTCKLARRRGVGGSLLMHILAQAKALGLSRLSLETGSFEYFAPARAMYAAHGFVECGPFGDYMIDPHSTYMTRQI